MRSATCTGTPRPRSEARRELASGEETGVLLLLATAAGWRWTDLEDSCRGPVGWDLACLRTTSRLDGRAALDALPGRVDDAELAPFVHLRSLHAAAWWFVHAAREPADLDLARDRLRAAVDRVSAGSPERTPGRG